MRSARARPDRYRRPDLAAGRLRAVPRGHVHAAARARLCAVLRDLSGPEHTQHHRYRAGVRREVLHAGVPAVDREEFVQPRLERQLVQPLTYYAADIASLRAAGGDVIPSFGGYSADHGGTEIADSCTNVQSIAADYEQVITTLGVTRLDMDVESSSLNNTAGITRRNQAIALTEQWAATQGIPLQIQYTIPVEQYGLDPNGEAVLQNAVTEGATVTSVNIMVFDYYIAKEGVVEMGTAAENAATNTEGQLATIFPGLTSAQLWHMEGMTLLPGIDDLRKKTEVTYEPDATTMLNFARANNMNFLSIWAIQRDNGGCPGTVDSNTCSGITQNTWDFSHILEAFTG